MTRSLGSTLRRLDANEMHHRGSLAKGAHFRWSWQKEDQLAAQVISTCDGSRLNLQYKFRENDAWTETNLSIRLVWKSCPFGGRRAFFACPKEGCSKKGYILYGDQTFVCRTCRRVAYHLQRIAPNLRALARAQQLRLDLGGSVEVNTPFPPRPKGMHDWTYTRRGLQIFAAERKAAEALITMFGKSPNAREEPPTLFDVGGGKEHA